MEKKHLIEQLHKKNYNCAQAFLCAFATELEIDEKKLFSLAEGLGRGVAGLENMCCVPIITAMIISYLETSDGNIEQPQSKLKSYACAKCLAMEFKDKYGSLKCRDILDDNTIARTCTDVLKGGSEIIRKCLEEE